jgi:hypothetical protein
MGIASCVFVGLEAGWCIVVAILLSIMERGSFYSFNQSFAVLALPIVLLLSIIGLLCGIIGGFTRDKTSSIIGIITNGIVAAVLTYEAL